MARFTRFDSRSNRRSFLGGVGMIADATLTPRKLFSLNREFSAASTPLKS
jgi:hypothetical protein